MALLSFQSEILEQILNNEKGLWIVESGLGLQKIIAHYIVQLEKRNYSKLLYLFLNPDPQVPLFDQLVQMAPHRYKLINSEYSSDQRYEAPVLQIFRHFVFSSRHLSFIVCPPSFQPTMHGGFHANVLICTDRQVMWNAGGVRFVTSRILIVDMLNGLIPWKKLGGIIYCMNQGQLIKENCTENFILRYYAQQVYNANRAHEQAVALGKHDQESYSPNYEAFDGYNDPSKATVVSNDVYRKLCIKAFTESPSAFAHGWNTLEKTTKALKVGTKVFIWPRFRKAVNECIKARQPESVQLHVDLAPIQLQIHQHLITIFKLSLEDLRRRCSGSQSSASNVSVSVSTPSPSHFLPESDISYDNALFSNFYSGIQAILEPLGSRVPRKIRSLLHDLNLLRDLLRTLIRCDAVTFYEKFHKMLRDQSAGDSNASLD